MDQQIDENLKRVYTDALDEKIPDKFMDLINQLKASDTSGKSGNDDK